MIPVAFRLVAAVAHAHERGWQGIRINANLYATGHWRCRVFVPEPGETHDSPLERESNVVLRYSSAGGEDVFQDGRTDWTTETLAGRFIELARPHAAASEPDAGYATWLAELRRRTGGGAFWMAEDAMSRQALWRERGLVCLWYADPGAKRADATGAVDQNGWMLDGTMRVPPAR
ncbi:hypothetical protein C1632_01360 [Microbacterium testaceum]|uniref:hypothetical protein n=1 Tax=Microbacterium testaceum TaxID=2033 RepID=UPI000CCEB125|nr:hypothetical protein [Microbacterium testaceum]PNW10460.1 hypothetical protein C1632_01360 [Microbacterium testaceum]